MPTPSLDLHNSIHSAVPKDLRNMALSSEQGEDQSKKKPKANSSSSSTLSSSSLEPSSAQLKHLDSFRVNLKNLSKRNEYQILRIETEGGALTPEEKLERRIIRSLRMS